MSKCEDPVLKKRKGQGSVDDQGVNSIGGWLEDVGFSRYAGVFEMHEVDEQALPFLTLNDLKEMGVLALGTQRKLYAAICGLKGYDISYDGLSQVLLMAQAFMSNNKQGLVRPEKMLDAEHEYEEVTIIVTP
ncbi:sterile alpha motif domain-containing protein [Tanacetum coccineum]